MDPSGLLITVDNGIAANEAVDAAKEKGMKVIILDHHEARILNGEQFLPEADVVIDPHITEADLRITAVRGWHTVSCEKFSQRREGLLI